MLSEQILKLFESAGIDPKVFDHFDYAEAFQSLKENYNSAVESCPKKKKIIQQFIEKAHQKIYQNNPRLKKQKVNNFMQRMEMNQRIHQEKIQALRFINDNYDAKSGQLWFYPNSNRKKDKRESGDKILQPPLSASRSYNWNIEDEPEMEMQQVEDQRPIMQPNLSEQYISGIQ